MFAIRIQKIDSNLNIEMCGKSKTDFVIRKFKI